MNSICREQSTIESRFFEFNDSSLSLKNFRVERKWVSGKRDHPMVMHLKFSAKKLMIVVAALFVWFQIGGGSGAVGQRSSLVEHASTPAGGTRSHAAAWNIPLQAGPADTQVPSAVEGETFSITQLYMLSKFISLIRVPTPPGEPWIFSWTFEDLGSPGKISLKVIHFSGSDGKQAAVVMNRDEGSYQISHIYLFIPNLSGERRLDRPFRRRL